jgi:lipopolysaccharide transport system permease protein
MYFLVLRDIKVRYKQTALGALWAVLQPFLTMVVFSIFFGRLAKISSDGLPYPLFAFCALVPWTFFAHAVTHSSASMVGHADLVKKVYFPRLLIPVASLGAGVVDFAVAFLVLLGMMAFYGVMPSSRLLLLPPLLLLATITALGVGFWLSATNVQFRDVRYTLPFLTQLWMFASPIAYPTSLLDESWQWLYSVNPMVGVIEGFRWALLGVKAPPVVPLVLSCLMALALFLSGAFYFRRLERTFADAM